MRGHQSASTKTSVPDSSPFCAKASGNGELSGDRVEGSTFPNWTGDVRTRKELQLAVDGDRMSESFQRPEGTRIVIIWERVH